MADRVLVSGAAGFVGRHLVRRLAATGADVVGVDIRGWNDAPAPMLAVDVRDGAALGRAFTETKPDAVVHLAAAVGVRAPQAAREHYWDTNVEGTRNVVAASRGVAHLVFASSSSVYGAATVRPSEEDDVLHPRSHYATTKIEAERLVAEAAVTCATALRLFTVYGPGMREDLALRRFARAMRAGEGVTLFGDGTSCRDYTHIDDVVRAIEGALTRPPTGFAVCNVGTGRTIALRDVVGALAAVLGCPARVRYADEHPADAPHTCADLARARALLDYVPRVRFEDGVSSVVDGLVPASPATSPAVGGVW